MILNSKSNLSELVTSGLIGWALFGFVDEGPKVFSISEALMNQYKISESEILALSVSLMTVSGLNQSFGEITFIVPFPASQEKGIIEEKGELFILCTSFVHLDPSVKDERMDGKVLAVYTIFLPKFFLVMLRNVDKITALVKDTVEKTRDIHDFNTEKTLSDLTVKVLDLLL